MKQINITNVEVIRYATSKSAMTGKTFDEVCGWLLEKAVKDAQYRSNRNAQNWQNQKNLKEQVKEMEAKLQRMETLQMIGAGREEEINA